MISKNKYNYLSIKLILLTLIILCSSAFISAHFIKTQHSQVSNNLNKDIVLDLYKTAELNSIEESDIRISVFQLPIFQFSLHVYISEPTILLPICCLPTNSPPPKLIS